MTILAGRYPISFSHVNFNRLEPEVDITPPYRIGSATLVLHLWHYIGILNRL
jgi:hypothetical protein